jgi:putative transposase
VAAFITAQGDTHRIPHAVACRDAGGLPGLVYKWASYARAGTLPPRAARRARLAAEVKRLFGLHGGKRGSPMITADLKDAGWRVSENTVAALMAGQGLAARAKRRRKSTTRPGRGRWRAPDLVKRNFPAARLNQKWYGDGTEIPTGEGKLYLASVMDAASRRILGFTLSAHHDAAAAYGALAMAITVRGGQVPGVIMHTDQGSEYTARAFQAACQRTGIAQSMGWPGSALDNAVIESWHSTLEFDLPAAYDRRDRMNEDAFHKIMAKVRAAEDWDDARRTAAIASVVDQLKADFNKRYDRQINPRGSRSRDQALAIAHASQPIY